MFQQLHLSVRARLIGTVALLLGLLSASTLVSQYSLGHVAEDLDALNNQGLVPLATVDRIARNSLLNAITLRQIDARLEDKAFVAARLADLDQRITTIDGLFKTLEATDPLPEVVEARSTLTAARKDFVTILRRGKEALASHQPVRTILAEELPGAAGRMQTAMDQLIEAQLKGANRLYADGQATVATAHQVEISGSIVALLLGLFLTWRVVRHIVRSLNHAVSVADRIAEGHLGHDIRVESQDEIARLLLALRRMDHELAEIVGNVRTSSFAVSGAAEQIAKGNDDLSQRTQEQASSLEETAASMEEMTSTVKQNAENASQANLLVASAREQAEHGGQVAAEARAAMAEISTSSHKIADIVGMIDEIAFQTNLLSLNAAVEAARAGEQGRGFAVVAGEVRTLSQRSAAAAKEIKLLIQEAVNRVDAGSSLVEQSSTSLAEIVASVHKVGDIVAEITAASHEQSSGIDQVNKAVMQMDEVTQQNAALVEEAASAAREMHDQASALSRQMEFFDLAGGTAVAKQASPAVLRQSPGQPSGVAAPVAMPPRLPPRRTPAALAMEWSEF